MAQFDVVMPKMGESIEEATITKWFVKEGDSVVEDDVLLEIATDKVDSEIPSPVEGVVKKVLFSQDDVVAVGTVIAVIDMDGENGEADSDGSDEQAVEDKEAGLVGECRIFPEAKKNVNPAAEDSSGDFERAPLCRKGKAVRIRVLEDPASPEGLQALQVADIAGLAVGGIEGIEEGRSVEHPCPFLVITGAAVVPVGQTGGGIEGRLMPCIEDKEFIIEDAFGPPDGIRENGKGAEDSFHLRTGHPADEFEEGGPMISVLDGVIAANGLGKPEEPLTGDRQQRSGGEQGRADEHPAAEQSEAAGREELAYLANGLGHFNWAGTAMRPNRGAKNQSRAPRTTRRTGRSRR